MPAIDHLVYAVPDLDDGVAEIAELTGANAVAGGSHPGAGTRNALLSFDDHTYFEIISVDPSQAEPSRPRPFGVDPSKPSRMASFAIHPTGDETIEDIAERMAGLGLQVGPVVAMSRQRPDGVELQWRLTLNREIDPSPEGGVVPFVIDWGVTQTPAASTPPMGRLAEVRITHPDAATVDLLRTLDFELLDGEVRFAVGPASLIAVVETSGRRMVEI